MDVDEDKVDDMVLALLNLTTSVDLRLNYHIFAKSIEGW
jgi:hypothetical protein